MIETTQRAVTPQQPTCHHLSVATTGNGFAPAHTEAADPLLGLNPVQLLMLAAAGEASAQQIWHYFRKQDATEQQWAALGRMQGYAPGWARHQYRCWTLQLDALNYAEQRAMWHQRDLEWAAEQQQQLHAQAVMALAPQRQHRRTRRPDSALRNQLSLLG